MEAVDVTDMYKAFANNFELINLGLNKNLFIVDVNFRAGVVMQNKPEETIMSVQNVTIAGTLGINATKLVSQVPLLQMIDHERLLRSTSMV